MPSTDLPTTEPISDEPALIAQNLDLKIDAQQILSDISFTLDKGNVLGVLGPNGAGKTSLLKILSGQLEGKGQVSWQHKEIADYTAVQRAQQIAVVNQLNDHVFALNLQQIVRMGLLPHATLLGRQTKQDQIEVAQAIEQVGLSDKTWQTFSSLSGGEQQRGLIARALVQKATLIVLDEPVNHLDVYYQHQILQLLTSLAKKLDVTVVMSLHDLNLAAQYCDHICLLEKGQLVATGSPNQVFTEARLERIYRLPCKVTQSAENSAVQVSFFPLSSQQAETKHA